MKYTVLIEASEEGFAVSVPGLPGCHSQGDTEEEALTNIADAIREYLDVVQELAHAAGAKQAEVEVEPCPGCQASTTSTPSARCKRLGIESPGKVSTS